MAIEINFNGHSLYKPGVYSKSTVKQVGGFPLTGASYVGIVGEAVGGLGITIVILKCHLYGDVSVGLGDVDWSGVYNTALAVEVVYKAGYAAFEVESVF